MHVMMERLTLPRERYPERSPSRSALRHFPCCCSTFLVNADSRMKLWPLTFPCVLSPCSETFCRKWALINCCKILLLLKTDSRNKLTKRHPNYLQNLLNHHNFQQHDGEPFHLTACINGGTGVFWSDLFTMLSPPRQTKLSSVWTTCVKYRPTF